MMDQIRHVERWGVVFVLLGRGRDGDLVCALVTKEEFEAAAERDVEMDRRHGGCHRPSERVIKTGFVDDGFEMDGMRGDDVGHMV